MSDFPPGPLVTIAVPSYNQGRYLSEALGSAFDSGVSVEVYVADNGSTDASPAVIRQWECRLAGWRSHPDSGQAAAINECIAKGKAPFVAWLNSDDLYLPGGLRVLLGALVAHPEWPAAYGRTWNVDAGGKRMSPVWVQPFSERWLARRCIVAQPGTLIRREAWEAIGGLDESLLMAMDYDLWWRLFRRFGPLGYVGEAVALNRNHAQNKTNAQRQRHYREAVAVVRRHYGTVPVKWWLAWPLAVWARSWVTPQKP
jgi:glycosyltransferase involved in cell wall biosynthesis